MKVILSRKGFDSASGGCPSFIVNDKLISLPIPDEHTDLKYEDVEILGYNLGKLFNKAGIKPKLDKKEINTCHLDPDIEAGLFGQCSTAAQHLINNDIHTGDLFLFFGWFKNFDINNYKFEKSDKNGKHCIYAYFKVGKILDLNNSTDKKEAFKLSKTHPHIAYISKEYEKTNYLFVANSRLSDNTDLKGFGRLRLSEETILSKSNENKSVWKLPKCFLNTEMSYHTNKNRWTELNKDYCRLKSVSRGQEFVIKENKEIETWAVNLIKHNVI